MNVNVTKEDNFDMFFKNAARHLIHVHDGSHAEWVLFRHGSLYVQKMPNNEETALDELINKAKENLSEVLIGPGSYYGDVTVYKFNYRNNENYYSSICTFFGIIMIHPSKQVTDNTMAVNHGRANVLSDKADPIVVTTGNTKQIS